MKTFDLTGFICEGDGGSASIDALKQFIEGGGGGGFVDVFPRPKQLIDTFPTPAPLIDGWGHIVETTEMVSVDTLPTCDGWEGIGDWPDDVPW